MERKKGIELEESVEALFREMDSLEMRMRGAIARRVSAGMAVEEAPPKIIVTHVGYHGIWE